MPVSRRAYERERAARQASEVAGARLALFADATKALTSSFDLDVVLRDLAHVVAPAFADACLIDLVEPDGAFSRAATAVAPSRTDWPAALEALRPPPERTPGGTAHEAVRSGMPQVIHNAGFSAVVVPLKGRSGTLGVLWLVQQGGAGQATVDLAEELARRASIAVENA